MANARLPPFCWHLQLFQFLPVVPVIDHMSSELFHNEDPMKIQGFPQFAVRNFRMKKEWCEIRDRNGTRVSNYPAAYL